VWILLSRGDDTMKLIKYLIVILLLICASTGWAKTATYTVNASANDSRCIDSEGCGAYYTQHGMYFPYPSTGSKTFFKWSINLPANVTLTSSYLTVYPYASATAASNINLDYVAEDSCGALAANLAVGGSPVTWTFGNWTAGTAAKSDADIKGLLSAWLGRAGYKIGNYFGLRGIYNTGAVRFISSWDEDPTKAAQLEVTYTGGDAIIEMMMSPPHVKTKQYVEMNIWNQDAGDILYVYLDNVEIESLRYTIQAGDVPANAATAFKKTVLMDYTGLSAGEHHIDAVIKTSGGTTRMGTQVEGKDLKTWTTTHDGIPAVGINENNAICIKNGSACDVYFPLVRFMYSREGWYPPVCYYGGNGICDPTRLVLNGTVVEGYYSTHDATSWGAYLDAAAAVTDDDTGAIWRLIGPGRSLPAVAMTAGNIAKTGLLGWIWEDEPELNSAISGHATPSTLGELTTLFNTTKINDTSHPHFMVHYGYPYVEGATNTAFAMSVNYLTSGNKTFYSDVTGGDYYPYEFATRSPNGKLVSLENALSADDSYIAYNYSLLPHFAIIQPVDERNVQTATWTNGILTDYTLAEGTTQAMCMGNTGALGSTTWTPPPTAAQVKNELWLRLIHGAKGLTYFMAFCPMLDDVRTVIDNFKTYMSVGYSSNDPLAPIVLAAKSSKYTPVTRTVGAYTVSLNHGTVTAGTDGRVDYMIREYGGKTWVFAARVKKISGETFAACNTTGVSAGAVRCTEGAEFGVWPDSTNTNTKSATIPVTGLANSTTVAVYGEGRNITSGDGTITDNFTDYDVHIYKLDASASEFNLTVTKTGDGSGTVTASPAGINCGSTCVYAYPSSTVVTLTASVVGNNALGAWSGGGCSGNGATCEVTVTEATEVTKSFTDTTPRNFNVTVSYTGTGTGTTSPAAGVTAYANNATATTTQTPSDNSTFSGWSGTCGCTGTGACAPTITADCSIIATWADNAKYTLSVAYPLHGEIVTSDVGGINCGGGNNTCVADFYSQVVTLTATCPSGFMSPTFGGDCSGSTCAPTLSANKQVSASCVCANCATIGSGGSMTLGSGGSGGAPACNAASDKLGTDDISGSAANRAKDMAYCALFTPSCYGTLTNAYVRHADTSESSAKVCVYSDDGNGIVGSGDLKIGCSNDITSSSVEFASAAMDGGTLTGGSYWVCTFIKADATNTFSLDTNSTLSNTFFKGSSGYYATPPDNLGGIPSYAYFTMNSLSVYVTVGP
jgi:hypothetical protein